MIQLREPPTKQFTSSLVNRGWQKQGDIYLNEPLGCFLEYKPEEQQLIIMSTLYLSVP